MTATPQQQVQPRANRTGLFWRYWSAFTISNVGDAVTTVALPLTAVIVLKASAFQVALLTTARYAGWLLIGLPSGVIVHRLPLRGAQVSMDLIRAAALLSVPIAAWAGVLDLAQLVGVAFVVGIASVIFDVGNSTFLPFIVPKSELLARNSLMSGSQAAVLLGGPSLGGLLVSLVGAATSIVADVVSYVISAVLLQGLPRSPRSRPSGQTRMIGQIKVGWHYVTRHPIIGPCALTAALTNFVGGGLIALTPVFLVRTLETPTKLVGVLMATGGLGSLLGAALAPKLTRRFGSARATIWTLAAASVAASLMPLASYGWWIILFALGNASYGVGVTMLGVVTRTHRQTASPPELLSRVMATVKFISWSVIPFGALAAGVMGSALGLRGAFWVLCALAVLAPLLLLASPVRRQRDLTDAVPPHGEHPGEH